MRISNNSKKEDREQPSKQTCSLMPIFFVNFLNVNVSDKIMRKIDTRH